MTTTTAGIRHVDWNAILVEQVDWHWQHQLRPRLEGLSDEEYFWSPTPGAWNIHPRGHGLTPMQGGSGEFTVDFAHPEPDPAPVTTIAWRLSHLIVGVLAMRVHSHLGGPDVDYNSFDYAGSADRALEQLDENYAAWIAGVRGWDDDALAADCGPSEGHWSTHPLAELVAHINRELIHHGAEIALLRDLFAHQHDTTTKEA